MHSSLSEFPSPGRLVMPHCAAVNRIQDLSEIEERNVTCLLPRSNTPVSLGRRTYQNVSGLSQNCISAETRWSQKGDGSRYKPKLMAVAYVDSKVTVQKTASSDSRVIRICHFCQSSKSSFRTEVGLETGTGLVGGQTDVSWPRLTFPMQREGVSAGIEGPGCNIIW